MPSILKTRGKHAKLKKQGQTCNYISKQGQLAYARVPARLPPCRSPPASAARARAAARAPCPPPPRRSPPPARRRSARRRPQPRPHAINAAELTGRPPLPRPPPSTSPPPINRPPPHLRPSTSSPTAASAPAQPRSAAATPASDSRRSLPWPGHLAASPPEVRARVEPPPPPQACLQPLAPSLASQHCYHDHRHWLPRTTMARPPHPIPARGEEGNRSPSASPPFPPLPGCRRAPKAAGQASTPLRPPPLFSGSERRKKGQFCP